MGACRSAPERKRGVAHPSAPQGKSGKVNVLELMSHTDPHLPSLLLSGSRSDAIQEAFADKQLDVQGSGGLDVLSEVVGYACQKGQKSTNTPNQDNFVILQLGSTAIYGVFDGHGIHGQPISCYVASAILRRLASNPKLWDSPGNAMNAAFQEVQADCIRRDQKQILDCKLSGTTATLMIDRQLKSGTRELCIAHCGDSRAVLGYCPTSGQSTLVAMDLTHDHKPGLEKERARICAAGGVVRQQNGDPNERVFLKNMTCPGLAMSRAIGDAVAASVGVISQPDVAVLQVQPSWQFVLLCSDGIWEFVTSQEAVDLVGKFPPSQAKQAVAELAQEARRRWLKEDDTVVDDITALCIWLQ